MALYDFNPAWEPLWCRICRLALAAVVKCVALSLFRLLWPLTSVSLVAQSVAQDLLVAHDWAAQLVSVPFRVAHQHSIHGSTHGWLHHGCGP